MGLGMKIHLGWDWIEDGVGVGMGIRMGLGMGTGKQSIALPVAFPHDDPDLPCRVGSSCRGGNPPR